MIRNSIIFVLAFTLNVHLKAEISEPILPLPQQLQLNGPLVSLGEKLFRDKRLSRDQTLACSSCHDLGRAGIEAYDTPARSPDGFNVPTIFNAGFHFKFLWIGRVETLEEQVESTVTSPTVLNNDWATILKRLRAAPEYQGQQLDADLIKKAIAEYERSLFTPNAPFDRYLRGDAAAITAEEKKGYEIFKDLGCSSCHQGMLLGGNMLQKFGVFRLPDPQAEQHFSARDLGRYAMTHQEADKFVFKVPSLRNVELTAPYFHNGSAITLEDAVAGMGRYQLGRELSKNEISAIVKFLKTLTGEWQGRRLR